MSSIQPMQGIGTLVNHAFEGDNPLQSHVTPIYQSSVFGFTDVDSAQAIFSGEQEGYYYTRLGNPNLEQYANKIAALEGIDLLRAAKDEPFEKIVSGLVFGSGMAAVTSSILASVQPGQAIISQQMLYSATFNFLKNLAPGYGIKVIWIPNGSPEEWEQAFRANPDAVLAYAETPVNPTLEMVDLAAAAEIAHCHGAWLMVDNTFATPYCQRPLTLGADVVLHSTTKYLSGHGLIIGGAAVSSHPAFVKEKLGKKLEILGGCASPFDAWLGNIGLKTFELRMQRHCENAAQAARYLLNHPKVARVYYPGLESNPQFELARRQMIRFGGMVSFELKGGMEAGKQLMNHIHVCTLAVSLGNLDSLICHPASTTSSRVPPEERQKMRISDGLVRFSVGVENIEDILADLEQALDF